MKNFYESIRWHMFLFWPVLIKLFQIKWEHQLVYSEALFVHRFMKWKCERIKVTLRFSWLKLCWFLCFLESWIFFMFCRASDLRREYDGACVQMRMSYSAAAQFLLFFVQWSDCHLAGALGLLRILIYKVNNPYFLRSRYKFITHCHLSVE